MDAATCTANVEVISKQLIKPSSLTPPHLKTLKLSLLDQLAPPAHIPLILFYQPDVESSGLSFSNQAQISEKLKQSLSETLTLFYPLAGKLDQENFTVDCNDNGVEFTETRALACLSDIIQGPSMELLKKYLPVDPFGGVPDFLLAVQVSFFDCGGIAIGLCLSHQIADAMSMLLLLKAWAAICRGDRKVPKPPVFGILARHFPTTRSVASSTAMWSLLVAKEKLVTKRLLFDKEKLAALKRAATISQSPNIVKDPTRVELVSAFIWKHLVTSDDKLWEPNNTLVASQSINLRPRISASTLGDDLDLDHENVFGNYFFLSFAFYGGAFDQCEEKSTAPELDQLVIKMRQVIRQIDEEYIRKAQGGGNYLSDLSKSLDLHFKGGEESCTFTSWCRFPVYEVDFGWGKPVWVGTATVPVMNSVILMDTKSGDGIEAWVNMVQDHATAFENQFKLLDRNHGLGV